MAKRSAAKTVVSITSAKVGRDLVVTVIVDLNAIKTKRDAEEAMQAVLKVPSVADRYFYILQIDQKRRDIELDARLAAIEGRLAAIEGRQRSAKRSLQRG
jgi:hypothetical protein